MTVSHSGYVGRPLVPHGVTTTQALRKVVIDHTLSLGGGELIGFTFLTISHLEPGIEIIPSVRLQIWEKLPQTQHHIQSFKLVLEERVELTSQNLGQNVTVSNVKVIFFKFIGYLR